ncbi:MAG: LysE family translocator [Cohaesibacteraceae bacterium]|nr:LysE family translocator [Cohaesibacteraceae bacterium]
MLNDINLPLILVAAFVASASPGPATMALAGTSMKSGRKYGLALAAGIATGSLIWSVSAAFGLAAVMMANAWLFEIVRYFGAAYLLYLAYKSLRSAFKSGDVESGGMKTASMRAAYGKGLAIHLTNPKAILFFGSLYSLGIPSGASPQTLLLVIGSVFTLSVIVFHGYALMFSSARVTAGYVKLRRWFEGVFALGFGIAGAKILTTSIVTAE